MKISIFGCLIFLLLTPFQSNFDLLDITPQATKLNDIVGLDTAEDETMNDKTFKITKSENLLSIGGLDLKNQSLDDTRSNHIWFEYTKEDEIIQKYQLVYYTEIDSSKIVYNKLTEKMGDPDYRYYNDSIDIYDDQDQLDFQGVVWEDRERGLFYMLRYTDWDHKIRELRLYVITNTLANLEEDIIFTGKPFEYWVDYISERESIKNPELTYQEFIKKASWEYRDHSK